MKKTFKKLLNIPTPYFITMGITTVILIIMAFQEEANFVMMSVLLLSGVLIILQMYFGRLAIKSFASLIAIIYLTSIYTNVIMDVYGHIVEPFLLSLAAVAIFLSVTYNSKKHTHGLRSRALWSFVFAIILISVKMAFIFNGFSLLIAETIGMNVSVLLIALWVVWINNSKKTKIIKPLICKEEVLDDFKFIYIENELNAIDKKWIGSDFDKFNNAYPYIYNEAMIAEENKLTLVLVSTLKTNSIYDVGEIKLNKSKTILYLYIEAKENDYVHDILESFIEELYRHRK